MAAQYRPRVRAESRRVLAVLQRASDDGWVELQDLIEQADLYLVDEELSTRLDVVNVALTQLEADGYQVEHVREEGGTFYRLQPANADDVAAG